MVRIGRTQTHKTFKDGVYKYIVGFQREKKGGTWRTRAIVFEKSPYSKTKRFVGNVYGKDKPTAFLNAKKRFKRKKKNSFTKGLKKRK